MSVIKRIGKAVSGNEQPAVPPVAAEASQKKAVVTALTRNRKIMLATIDGQKNQRVYVRETDLFVPGMEIPVKHMNADLFEFVGRLPRFRGKL